MVIATIEQLERKSVEMKDAEAAAIGNLIAHLRESAVRLPENSKLALTFASVARGLGPFATREDAGLWGRHGIALFARDYIRENTDKGGAA